MRACVFLMLLVLVGCAKKDPSGNMLSERELRFQIMYQFILHDVKNMRIQALLPQTIPGKQQVEITDFSLTPNFDTLENGSAIGLFRYFHPKDTVNLVIQGKVLLTPDTSLRLYSEADRKMLLQIQEKVASTFEYVSQQQDQSLEAALASRKGDCSEYAAYAVKLCQDAGWEAREVAGIHARKGMDPFHSWTECRRPGLPWVPLEPTWADEPIEQADSLERKGLEAIHQLRGTTWKMQIGIEPRLKNGLRLLSWTTDRGEVRFSSTAWMHE